MLRLKPIASKDPGEWQFAALLAAFIFNAALLEPIGRNYRLIGAPITLGTVSLLYAAFLCAAVFYGPMLLGGDCRRLIEEHCGSRTLWFFDKILVPVWGISCFIYCSGPAQVFIGTGLKLPLTDNLANRLATGAIWFAVLAPAVSYSIPRLASASVFIARVAFIAVAGLMFSATQFGPQWAKWEPFSEALSPLPLEPEILLWIAPPVMLCLSAIKDRSKSTSIIALAGIAGPALFAPVAAIITVAGGAAGGSMHMKLASYAAFVAERPGVWGRGKILILALTLLTSSRFALMVIGKAWTPEAQGWKWLLAALLIAAAQVPEVWLQLRTAWMIAGIPFICLSGVLCGILMNPGHCQRSVSLTAWISGCIATALPMLVSRYSIEGFHWGPRHLFVLIGWTLSFAIASHNGRRSRKAAATCP